MHASTLAGLLPLLSLAAAGLIERSATTACNRDNVFRCILSSSAVGKPYCSSVLSYGTVTSYTSTFTPTATSSVSTTQSATTSVTTTGTATATITDDFTVTVTDSVTTIDTSITTTTLLITMTAIPPLAKRAIGAVRIYSEIYGNSAVPRNIEARATTSPAPSCLAQFSPAASRITSACSCLTSSLSITSATIFTVSTAPTVTVTNVNTISTTETDSASITTTVITETSTTEIDQATTTVTDDIFTTTTTALISTVTQACPDCYLCSSSSQCAPGFECAAYFGFSFGQVQLCSNKTPGAQDYTCSSICTN